jgi:predicted ATPase/DNA-binding SARP family transcriptional activator
VHGLRQALGPDRIETHGVGYRIRIDAGELDFERFEQLLARGRRSLDAGRPGEAAEDLRRALDLWTGPALADLRSEPLAELEAGRLDDLRLQAVELRNDAELALGRHDALLAELESLIAEHPFRERLREQHMLALYRSGRQKDALEAYREARSALDELGVEPSPGLRELERGILRHDPELEPPELQPRAEWHVPVPSTPLVGRRLEVAAVSGLLRRDDIRLVTLTGPGGTGKTRLALAVADELGPDLHDGAAFVDLAAVQDASLLGSTIAHALGIQEGDEPLSRAVGERLREHSVLLVLDNLEQLLAGATFVAELLAAAPRLLVLATSRAPLRLSGEQVYPVPPLPTPDPLGTFEELAGNDAVRLFVARARAVDPSFELTEAGARDVAEICRRLDGLPLAIELAAARSNLLPTEAMARRLGQSLELLTGGARDLPERQQTLRATLDWSYGLLSAAEQTLFARLAVFAGGCTVDALEAVCGEDDADVLAITASLLDESLVRRDDEGRLGMLETIREYALERLESSDETDELRRRHARYFAEVAEAAERELTRSDELRVHERLEREHDNFRAALSWSQQAQAPDIELSLAATLARFWLIQGHLREGRRWLEDALSRDPGAERAVRAKALRGLAVLAIKHRDLEDAERFLEESIALSRELGDTASLVRSMLSLGVVAGDLGDPARSKEIAEETISLAAASDDLRVVSTAINNLADLALNEGEYDEAARLARESVERARALGNREGATLALLNLAQSCLYLQRLEEAAVALEEALLLANELGYREAIAYALEGFASIAADREDPARGARILGAGESVLEAIGASLDPAGRERHALTVRALRDRLDDASLAEHVSSGRALGVEEATAEALAVAREARAV